MADTRTPRPDLAALEYTSPVNLTPMIFPSIWRALRQGRLYYQDIQTDVVAQTGRTPGDAPTTTVISDESTAFNLENDEFIDRQQIPDADIAGLGGLDAAQQVAARVGKRAVGNSIENLTATNILLNGAVTYTAIGSSLIRAVQLGYNALEDLPGDGQIALVITSRLFSLIRQYEEIVDRFKFTGVIPSESRAVRNISAEQLAMAIGVDRVIVGRNARWYDPNATMRDRAALVKLPAPGVDPIEDTQVGRTVWFSPTGEPQGDESLFECHSYFSADQLSEMVDTRAYAEQHVLNVELIYGLGGISETLLPS